VDVADLLEGLGVKKQGSRSIAERCGTSFACGFVLILACIAWSGCNGYVEHPYEPGPSASADDETSTTEPGDDEYEAGECVTERAPLTRLNRWEYRRTLEDLFPNTDLASLSRELDGLEHPASPNDHGFDNYAADLEPSKEHVEYYFYYGEAVAERVMQTQEEVDRIMPSCEPQGGNYTECGREFLETFGTKVFRRPLSDEQLDYYDKYYEAPPEGATFEQATQLTLQLMLAAPEFIYRIEEPAEQAAVGQPVRVDAYSLASRMSYFLWGSMPDDELMAAAANGDLDTQEGVRAEAERMMENPRAIEAFLHFHENWLKLEELDHTTKSDSDNFDHDTREAMREETEQFLAEIIFRDNGSLDDLLVSRETFVNARLAELYGLTAPTEEWEPATLPEGQRAGIFTQPTFLASRAHPDKPSPVLRGSYIIQDVMCMKLGSPPDDAESQASEAADALEPPFTNREYYDATTMQGACKSCHTDINGVGYAFENYDTMGRWRDQDNGMEVDASGGIFDYRYDDAVGLMHVLKESERVESCVTEKWMRYARGSEVLVDNPCVAEDVLQEFRASDRSLRQLPLMIVTHPDFAMTRIADSSSGSE
jgi:hypothetical protein